MSARSKAYAATLSKGLRRDQSSVRKSLQQDAKEQLTDPVIGGKPGRGSSKPVRKTSAIPSIGKGALGAPSTAARKMEDVRARFESDVEMKSAVERGRTQAISPDLTDRERKLERFKRVAADNPKSVNALVSFGLEPDQARTLEQLLGQLFGQPIVKTGTRNVRKAQSRANNLIAAMKKHWDDALPKGTTREAVLKSAFDRLKAAQRTNPNVNPSRFVRKELFDPWRKRAMQRLGADRALVAELRAATGIEIITDSDVPKFSLTLKVDKTQVKIGFDVDHAETRLSDAVREAKRPDDLLSVIDSEGMQLLTPRENRLQIERLRKASREYFDKADEAAVDYFRRKGVDILELNREIDEMLDVLDGPGETF